MPRRSFHTDLVLFPALLAMAGCRGCDLDLADVVVPPRDAGRGTDGPTDADVLDVGADTDADGGADINVFPDVTLTLMDATILVSSTDSACRPLPDVTTPTVADASCGDGCMVLAPFGPDYPAMVAGRGDQYAFESSFTLVAGREPAVPSDVLSSGADGSGWQLCQGIRVGYQTSLTMGANALAVGCYVAGHDQIHEIRTASGTECLLFDAALPTAGIGTSIVQLLRVTSGYVWTMAFTEGPTDVYYLPDGSNAARAVTDCHCVNYIAGSGDTVSFIRWEPTGFGSLWVTHPPFVETREVWAPRMPLEQLSADADDPTHIVLVGGSGYDPTCPLGADIYFADLAALPGTQPLNLTNDATVQAEPQIRGDRVAFVDFTDDPSHPTCENSATQNWIVVSSLSAGGRTLVRQGVTTLDWLGLNGIIVSLPDQHEEVMVPFP